MHLDNLCVFHNKNIKKRREKIFLYHLSVCDYLIDTLLKQRETLGQRTYIGGGQASPPEMKNLYFSSRFVEEFHNSHLCQIGTLIKVYLLFPRVE